MSLNLQKPILYLVTSGETSSHTTPATKEYAKVLSSVEAAVDAGINLVQLREKNLTGRVLFQLASDAAKITTGSTTRLLINDRSDIAAAAGADGVHLTAQSLPASVVRSAFGKKFIIGVSTHSLEQATEARRDGANFVVFGPIFDTQSKRKYGAPQGIEVLREVCTMLHPFPVIAIGGIRLESVAECVAAGAAGVAAIGMFSDSPNLGGIVTNIRGRLAK